MKISSLLIWCVSASFLAATPSLRAQLGGQPTGTATSLTSASPTGSKSVDLNGNPFSVTFSNQTGSSVKVYWVDTNGINQEVGTLFVGQAAQITTYPGHVTVFTSNGQQVAKFVATTVAPGGVQGIVGNSSSNAGSAGGNNFASGGIPNNSMFIPGYFLQNQGTGGGLGGQGGQSMSVSNLENFIKSLSSSAGSNNNLGFGTKNQTNSSVSNLATLIALAQNRKNKSQTGTNLSTTITSTSNMTPQQAQAMVNFHNRVRAEVGLGPVTWDPQLAAFAQNWSNQMSSANNFSHNPNRTLAGVVLGENIAWSSAAGANPTAVADGWYTNEKGLYTPGTVIGPATSAAGHYTQMVWGSSNRIGAGVATGPNGTYVTCNYSPAGNITGQRPF